MSAHYEILIVEQRDEEQAATVSVAPYETPDAQQAKLWADAFNHRELSEPLGLWAVVRAVRDEQLHNPR
ncbi:MAG TPA: hypothetical protein VFW87_25770 [Pirellulales bacterium]|nr:hypothetical protein [Pirellulales bacterium]